MLFDDLIVVSRNLARTASVISVGLAVKVINIRQVSMSLCCC